MLNIPPHLEACRPRGLFSIFHGTSSPVARRCPRASDLVLSAEHAFLLYERPGLHLQSGASAVGGVLHGARRQVWAGLADPMRISIHAPRAGCDVKSLASCAYSFYFNPRTPCGVRRRVYSSISQRKIFQSTHPVRGATSGVATSGLRRTQFQSTHPVRGATRDTRSLSEISSISIHAPRAGCDSIARRSLTRSGEFQSTHPVRGATEFVKQHFAKGQISIHAPRAGCDRATQGGFPCRRNFNPRTPCGVRPSSAVSDGCSCYFNPRTPCGVRPRIQKARILQ